MSLGEVECSELGRSFVETSMCRCKGVSVWRVSELGCMCGIERTENGSTSFPLITNHPTHLGLQPISNQQCLERISHGDVPLLSEVLQYVVLNNSQNHQVKYGIRLVGFGSLRMSELANLQSSSDIWFTLQPQLKLPFPSTTTNINFRFTIFWAPTSLT